MVLHPKSCCRALPIVLMVALIAVRTAPALAWGVEGHEVTALVAEHFLEPAAKKKLDALLASDHDTLTKPDLASRAVWADKFRDSDRNTTKVHYLATQNWHFVDIELSAPNFDEACFNHPAVPTGTPASKGPAKSCVADKIEQFRAELKDPRTAKAERLLALKFLLHFVGDIHQPMHAVDNHDRGGNSVPVLFGRHTASSALHHYWDEVLVEKLGKDAEQVAETIAAKYKDRKSEWMQGDPKDWALQSFAVARDVAYMLPSSHARDKHGVDCVVLDQAYEDKSVPRVEEQLAKGGMRLAKILNEALQ